MQLRWLGELHAVVRLGAGEPVPEWAGPQPGAVCSATRTAQELSVVCAQSEVPAGIDRSGGWRAFRVEGTLDHGMVGVLAALATPLAATEVPVFVLSTFDTDYVLVPDADAEAAERALAAAGHEFVAAEPSN